MGSDANEEQPNVWIPDSTLPGFQSFVKVFYAECWKTSQLVLRALALGLGLEDETALLKHHHERENEVSFRHYPPVGESKIQSGEMDRLGAHTDFDSFTLLFQDSLGGLKVKHPITKTWIDAPPIEGALIMNIGDVLSRWSNGKPLSRKIECLLIKEQITSFQQFIECIFLLPRIATALTVKTEENVGPKIATPFPTLWLLKPKPRLILWTSAAQKRSQINTNRSFLAICMQRRWLDILPRKSRRIHLAAQFAFSRISQPPLLLGT